MNKGMNMITALSALVAIAAFQMPTFAQAATQAEMRDVLKIARGISAVQPFLPNGKYVAYAIAIHKASRRFDIPPALLISIAQQESGFRADLPEGAAGEIGICQILKSWLTNTELKKEFGNLTVNDLKKPVVSFQISAWILKELQDRVQSGPLPFWSFYNSPNFKHRLKYYQRVSAKMHTLKKQAPEIYQEALMYGPANRVLASLKTKYQPAANAAATTARGRIVKAPLATSRMPRIALSRHAKQTPPNPTNPHSALLRTASVGLGMDEETIQD